MYSDPALLESVFGRRADGRDMQVFEVPLRQAQLLHPLPQRPDAVHTGKDQPVVTAKILERGIQRFERARLADFNKRNLKNIRAQLAQLEGERTRLMPCPADQNSNSA